MKHYVLVKIVKRLNLIFFFLMLMGCNHNSISKENLDDKSTENISLNKNLEEPRNALNLKIIKSARTKYKVENVKKATKNIKILANNYGGYISDLQFQNNLYRIENRFTIKIPKENFDVFLDSIHSFITFIDYENINTKDVTEEFFDAESRLKTKEEVKKRYEEILREKAKTVDDVLNTEEKLRVIQEKIEATKGKLKYFENRISYSTIEIELYQEVDYKPEQNVYNKSFLSKIKEGFLNGVSIISNLIIVIINIWPIFFLGLGIFIIYKKRKNSK